MKHGSRQDIYSYAPKILVYIGIIGKGRSIFGAYSPPSKHGKNPYAGPLHISIRTRKTESGSEIIVSDDGSGYVSGDDSEPHIALKNIRERLDFMCGGNMTITTGERRGTVVTITIPDNFYDNKAEKDEKGK